MRRQLVPGLVVRLTILKAKTWPGIEASYALASPACYRLLVHAQNYWILFLVTFPEFIRENILKVIHRAI